MNRKPNSVKGPSAFKTRLRIRGSVPSLRKFRKTQEIRDFYRFIYENNLRKESLEILEEILSHRKAKKLVKKRIKH